MSGSTVVYNGVTLHDVSLQSLDQTPQYDPTGVDPIYVRTTVTVTGVVHLGSSSSGSTPLGVTVGTLGDMQASVINKLTVPRRDFKFYFGSTSNLLMHVVPSAVKPSIGPAVQPSNAYEDLNHGPKPQVVVNRIRSDRSARVTFRVELAIWDCGAGPQGTVGDANGVTNLRYYASDDIGDNWGTTRTLRGRLRVTNKNINLHALRGYMIPPLQPGFRRTHMHFAESPNGLEMEFVIKDVEEHASPPRPATTWSARYDVTTNNGAYAVVGMQVQLEGPPRGDRKDLLKLAMKIIDNKLEILSLTDDGLFQPVVIEHASFSEQLEANKVQAVMRIKKMPKDGEFAFFHIIKDQLGEHLPEDIQEGGGYDHNYFQKPIVKASLIGLFYSALQDPCEPSGGSQATATIEVPVRGAGPSSSVDDEGADELPNESGNNLDPLESQSIYLDYRMSSTYRESTGYGSLPVAQSSNGTTDPFMFRMHMGLPVREVIVEAERIGKWPSIPTPVESYEDQLTGIRHTLKGFNLTPSTPKLSPDGVNFIYRVHMNIEWNLGKRVDLGMDKQVWSGSMPYDTNGLQDTMLPLDMFKDAGLQ